MCFTFRIVLKINCLNHITVKYIGNHELMNSFYKTEAAIFPHWLCYLRAFPFIRLFQVSTYLRLFLFKNWTPSVYCFQTSYEISAVLNGPYSHITRCSFDLPKRFGRTTRQILWYYCVRWYNGLYWKLYASLFIQAIGLVPSRLVMFDVIQKMLYNLKYININEDDLWCKPTLSKVFNQGIMHN